jgi:hypothetical protein
MWRQRAAGRAGRPGGSTQLAPPLATSSPPTRTPSLYVWFRKPLAWEVMMARFTEIPHLSYFQLRSELKKNSGVTHNKRLSGGEVSRLRFTSPTVWCWLWVCMCVVLCGVVVCGVKISCRSSPLTCSAGRFAASRRCPFAPHDASVKVQTTLYLP